MTPNERAALTKLLALKHPTLPQTNRFHLRKGTVADFNRAVELRGSAAAPPKKEGTLKAFGEDLKPVMGDDTGGVFAEWTVGKGERPIVYFGSEGQIEIAATNARELLGMLAHARGDGWTLRAAMTVVTWELLALDREKTEQLVGNLVAGAQAELDDEAAAILASVDLPVIADVLGRARTAAQQYLWAFIDKLDTIVTGYPAQHTWHTAWNAPDADLATTRAFSPKERYAVGERVTYSWKSAAVGPQRAVVLAHPQASRVLLADRSQTSMRAYT